MSCHLPMSFVMPAPLRVMPAFGAGIHDFEYHAREVVDGRAKPGHDERKP
jgi:hypothetical protein